MVIYMTEHSGLQITSPEPTEWENYMCMKEKKEEKKLCIEEQKKKNKNTKNEEQKEEEEPKKMKNKNNKKWKTKRRRRGNLIREPVRIDNQISINLNLFREYTKKRQFHLSWVVN